MAEIQADKRRGDDAQRQQPLKNARALATIGSIKTFRKIERHHDADESGADALQQPAQNQRFVALRQRNHRDADDKQNAAQCHHFFAPQPVGQQAGK